MVSDIGEICFGENLNYCAATSVGCSGAGSVLSGAASVAAGGAASGAAAAGLAKKIKVNLSFISLE